MQISWHKKAGYWSSTWLVTVTRLRAHSDQSIIVIDTRPGMEASVKASQVPIKCTYSFQIIQADYKSHASLVKH